MMKRTPLALLWFAGALSASVANAQCSLPCPANATDAEVGVGSAAFLVNPDGSTGYSISTGAVGQCQKVRLQMSIGYVPNGLSGSTAAFSGGRLVIRGAHGVFSQDVTHSGGAPIIAPQGDTIPGGAAVVRFHC
jgi:hypothetical protein